MALKEYVADSLASYLTKTGEILAGWRADHKDAEAWYRGHFDTSWSLRPSAYRKSWDEESLLNRFRAEAASFVEPSMQPAGEWAWYFTGQHYDLPTRLLDWSEDPFVALHFAVRDMREDDEDFGWQAPEVWMLEPGSLNAVFHGESCDMVYVVASTGSGRYWLPSNCERGKPREIASAADGLPASSNEFPMAIHPVHATRRIVAQRGKFTVHGTNDSDIATLWEARCPATRGAHLCRIRITDPARVSRELFDAGYAKFRLFPELHRVSRHLRRVYAP